MGKEDTREKVLHVLSLLERGLVPGQARLMTVTSACFEVGLSYGAFQSALRSSPLLKEMYETALKRGEDVLADVLISIDEYFPDPKMASVISKNIQWLLSRRRRQDYGDHVVVEHTTTRDQVLLKRMEDARERALGNDPGVLVEGQAVATSDPPESPSGEPAGVDLSSLLPPIPTGPEGRQHADPSQLPEPSPLQLLSSALSRLPS
jgi:hypothetical protein